MRSDAQLAAQLYKQDDLQKTGKLGQTDLVFGL